MKVVFRNKGLIDPLAITTFGVNAKETDNPIGFFGTGLKYAIAVLLREKQEIIIYSGDKIYEFTLANTILRDKQFDVVLMNGQPIGFTTELGKQWEMWKAFRELYCNTIDEEGEVLSPMGEVILDPEDTTVIVAGNKFYECYTRKEEIVLEDKPILQHKMCDVHTNKNARIYYKGVRIYDLQRKSLYTYNVKSPVAITEDRTAKYSWEIREAVSTAVVQSNDPAFIEDVLFADSSWFEHALQFDSDPVSRATPSDMFFHVCEKHRLTPGLNKSIHALLHRHKRVPQPSRAAINNIQEQILERACVFCERIGYAVRSYPIVVSNELKSGMMGLAENGTIYLSVDTFGQGTKYVASTLIEEFLHLHTGYCDMSRDLQNHLFNDLVSLGERLIGEPV